MSPDPVPATSSERRAAVLNMAWLLGDKALALLVGLVIVGVIARSHGPVGAGHFAYGASMLQTGLALSLVCAGVALLPRFCRLQGAMAGAVANVFALRVVASVLATGLAMGYCLLTVQDPDRLAVTLLMLVAVPLIEPFYVVSTYWLSRNHNRPTVIARSSGLLARAALVGAGVWWGAPLWVLALAWILEAVISAALQSWQARQAFAGRPLRRLVSTGRMRSYLLFGLRFVLALWVAQLFIRLDRLMLAQWMDAHDFGIYAAPIQLVEVWSNMAYLIGASLATAYLYRRLADGRRFTAILVTACAMVLVGVLGLVAAWLLGPLLLRVVFGPAFEGSLPYLVAGSAAAVLVFADYAIEMVLTADNRPWLLAMKSAVSLLVLALVLWYGFAALGPMAGPAGTAIGIVAGWLFLWAHREMVRRHRLR
jgi:PST family polysaccharide transporter